MIWYSVFLFFLFCTISKTEERPLVVVVTSYNNLRWYKKNLDSVLMQQYDNYHVIYIDDCSTDGTADMVQAYITTANVNDKITLVKNSVRRGQLYNIYIATHCCPNNAIIVTLDGDDWFAHDNVLSVINHAYDNPNVLMTYGQFKEYPKGTIGFCREIPDIIKKNRAYRYYDWITSHVRTFYAGLFKEIPIGCFIRGDDFIRAACDHAFMFPLLELAGDKVSFIAEVLYIYNTANSNNIFRKDPLQQLSNAYWIRGRQRLQELVYNPSVVSEKIPTIVYNVHFSTESVEMCKKYLETLSIADIDPTLVIVLYDALSEEIEERYKKICTVFGVSCCSMVNYCTYKKQLSEWYEHYADNTFLLLTSDGCAWIERCDFNTGVKLLRQTKALGYSYMLYNAIHYADSITPHLISLYKDIYVWKYAENEDSWHMPYSARAVLYPLIALWPSLNRIDAQTVGEYVQKLSIIPTLYFDDVGVSTTHTACQWRR